MRIVMPLFDFDYKDSQEFVFGKGEYALRKFIAHKEVPLAPSYPGFSEADISCMESATWALVAENTDLKNAPELYKAEVARLLLSFKICKLTHLFIKYRLCKDNIHVCARLGEEMHYISPAVEPITCADLRVINNRFVSLSEMETVSNRTYNAMYFIYRGYHSEKPMVTFMLLMIAIEAFFSNEKRKGMTETICSRVSKFLGCKARCEYTDIEKLYDLRSKIVHGKFKVPDEIKSPSETLDKLCELEYVLRECMKKMLDEKIYLKYGTVEEKEKYFNDL